MGAGEYISSLPLVIILLAYKYGEKSEDGTLKTLRAITTSTFIWGSYIFRDGTMIYLSIITWILVAIPLSLIILNLISKNLSSRKLNIKQLDILGIPQKVIIAHLAILIIAYSLIISGTMMLCIKLFESNKVILFQLEIMEKQFKTVRLCNLLLKNYTSFIYNENSKWYIEQPYYGVYEIKKGLLDFLPHIETLAQKQNIKTELCDLIPMVMVKGNLHLDTRKESDINRRCEVMDG